MEVTGTMTTNFLAHYDSPLGGITLASDGTALTGLWFDGQRHFGETLRSEHAVVETCHGASLQPIFHDAARWLDTYFSGGIPDFTPSIVLHGSEFRQAVWRVLQTIPYGQTVTYGDIARQLAAERGIPKVSARAVGGAVGHNPISLIIPCHRVIGANGSLTGYAGGVERKAWLLRLEGR
jgi:methylated-DNA-[protein]-cysteine S-methyltransferase